MATRLLTRRWKLAFHQPACAALSTGIFLFTRPRQAMLCDAMNSRSHPPKERFDPKIARQLASGSMTGFCAGLFISVFSKTIALLAGIAMIIVQIAARYGINLFKHLKLRERLESSRIVTMLRRDPIFKLTFALAFSLAAFAKF